MRRGLAVMIVACAALVPASLALASPVAVLAPGSTTIRAVPRPHFRVVVVDSLTGADLQQLAARGAIGLLVPGAGARTDRPLALRALTRGINLNAAVRGIDAGRALISVETARSVPLNTGTIVVVLPTSRTLEPNDRRYPIAVVGAGYHGLLTSPTTRIPGLVSIVDVAPTALGHLRGTLGHVPSAHALARIDQLDARIHASNRMKLPVLLVIAGFMLLLALVRPRLAVPATLAVLLTNAVAGAADPTNETVLMAMMVVGSIWLCAALARLCRDDRRLLAAIVGVLGAYLVLLVARPEWIAISPLGPTQNSRFWGIGNQLETLMVVPVVVGAAIAARRYRIAGLTAFSLLALVLITDNRLGSDGGGAIVFGVALAYVGARCCGLGARGFATLLGLSATVVLGVITLNLRSPTPDHLRSAFVHGWSGVARVVIDRIPLAYRPAWQHWQLFLPLGVLLAGAFLVALRIADRRARDLVLASGIALATSLLVNDSAVYEATAGIAVISAVARFSTPTAPVAFRVPARARVALRAED